MTRWRVTIHNSAVDLDGDVATGIVEGGVDAVVDGTAHTTAHLLHFYIHTTVARAARAHLQRKAFVPICSVHHIHRAPLHAQSRPLYQSRSPPFHCRTPLALYYHLSALYTRYQT